MKRHKRPCSYHPNSSATFNMELIGDLTFKLNPGPTMNRTIPVIVSSQAKRSHATRPSTVLQKRHPRLQQLLSQRSELAQSYQHKMLKAKSAEW